MTQLVLDLTSDSFKTLHPRFLLFFTTTAFCKALTEGTILYIDADIVFDINTTTNHK